MRRPPIDERLAAIPLFAGLDARQLTCVASLATPIDVGAGRELIREGQTGREFFLVIEGEAEVTRAGEHVATLGPGTFFGETALLLDRPRNATVTAATDMVVDVIERRDFKGLLEEYPDLYAPLLEAAARQLDGAS
ncbi:MAG: cyclic nucleotide-binding domain-containing protein [Acidimicrobiales bacterium]|nr:cyclic nucleotide-binding domain-containing protein [Acidimicrobiales bacterium]MCB9371161.1 cyclic nucleotide-binding domain-containing protein [Microthrixaceae bacterium]